MAPEEAVYASKGHTYGACGDGKGEGKEGAGFSRARSSAPYWMRPLRQVKLSYREMMQPTAWGPRVRERVAWPEAILGLISAPVKASK